MSIILKQDCMSINALHISLTLKYTFHQDLWIRNLAAYEISMKGSSDTEKSYQSYCNHFDKYYQCEFNSDIINALMLLILRLKKDQEHKNISIKQQLSSRTRVHETTNLRAMTSVFKWSHVSPTHHQ